MNQAQRVSLGAVVILAVAAVAFSAGVLVARPKPSPTTRVAVEATTTAPSPTTAQATTTTSSTTTTMAAATTIVVPTTQPPTTTATTSPLPPTSTISAALQGWASAYAAMRAELEGLDVDPNSSDPCGPRLEALNRSEPQLAPAPTPLLSELITHYLSELRTMLTRCLAQENATIETAQAVIRTVHSEIVGAIHSAGGTYEGP